MDRSTPNRSTYGGDADAFQRGMARAGARAVAEFVRAEQIWAERAGANRR
jgi:hypothetical protein